MGSPSSCITDSTDIEEESNVPLDSKINENEFYDIELLEVPIIEGETEIDDSDIDNRHLIRGRKITLVRSQGARNLNKVDRENNSIVINEKSLVRSQGVRNLNKEDTEKNSITVNERSSLSKFVKNMNRRISRSKEKSEELMNTVSTNTSLTNIEYDENDINSLRFYYNFDLDDNHCAGETTTSYDNYEKDLPDIFNDGNFEFVDGLIMFVEKPVRKKSDLIKSSILFQRSGRGQSCQVKKELKPRAA